MPSSRPGSSRAPRMPPGDESHGQEENHARRSRCCSRGRGEPRYTRDVDLAVSVEGDDEAERLLYALTTRGYLVDTVIEQTRTT